MRLSFVPLQNSWIMRNNNKERKGSILLTLTEGIKDLVVADDVML